MTQLNQAQVQHVEELIEKHGVHRRLSPGQRWDVALIFGAVIIGATTVAAIGLGRLIDDVARESAQQVTVSDAVAVLRTNQDFINRAAAAAPTLPTGTVIAFAPDDPQQTCPSGFSRYDEAVGRVVIGAGTVEKLTPRAFKEVGGEEQVTLTLAQIPPHSHPTSFVILGYGGGGDLRHGVAHPIMDGFPPDNSKLTGTAGGGQPHNNMPPYIALYFCKKD